MRVVSGVILAGLLLAAVWIGGAAFYVLAAVAAAIGTWEYSGLMTRLRAAPLDWVLYPLVGWLLYRFQLPARLQPLELGLGAGIFAGLTACLLLHLGVVRWAVSMAGSLYIGLTLGYYLALLNWRPHDGHFGSRLLTTMFLAVAACDIAAYFAGTAFGRHRFFASISPKKTAEGAVAGLAGSSVVMCLMGPLLIGMGILAALGLGVLIGAAAQAGDLAESALKREAQVKDSSALIPGHGGVLDRLDSLLFVGPVVYVYLLALPVR
ncbi:MAG: phosphatidate cytidylyltransferase [Candidatus Dormibacteria bacterium]